LFGLAGQFFRNSPDDRGPPMRHIGSTGAPRRIERRNPMPATAAYGALALRVTLGIAALAHGLLKLLVFTPAGTVKFFASLGLPEIAAYAVIAAEVVGGLLLIAGAYVRLVSLALVPVLLGAVWVHSGNGWLFSAPRGGWEFPAFWTMALVAQALLGAGAFAVKLPDPAALLGRREVRAAA
jgi:putative oxidoreductase